MVLGPLLIAKARPRAVQRSLKRAIDICGAVCGLIMFAIPMLVIAVAIKLDSRGPVSFRQDRVGLDGQLFQIIKFRTMVPNAEGLFGGITTWRGDPRVTRVGRVLRDRGLDEILQFLNVLAGELSLVGPRPTVPSQVRKYTGHQRRRLTVTPGMTSLPTAVARNQLPWPEKIELDLQYIDNWSLWLDLKILFLTVWVVLTTREGAFKRDF